MGEAAQLLTSSEAAARLRMSVKSLHRLRLAGKIRYVAITDRKIMFKPIDCAEYIDSRVRQDEAAPKPRRTKGQPVRRQGNVIAFTEMQRR